MVNQFTVPPDAREPSRPSGDAMTWLSEAILETWRRAVDRLGSGFVHRLSEEGGANALYFRARASARAGDLEKAAQQFADLTEMAPDPDGRLGRPWRGRGQAGPERACPKQIRRRAQVALGSQAWCAGPAVCLAQSRPVPGRDRRLYVRPAVGEGTGATLRRARQRPARRGSRQTGTSRLQLRAQSETGHSRDHRTQSRSPAHAGSLRGGAARLRYRSCRPSERCRKSTAAAPSPAWRFGRLGAADADWRRQSELLPPEQASARACVSLRMADYEAALPSLQRALEKEPGDPYWRSIA